MQRERPDGTLVGEPPFALFAPRYLIQPDDAGIIVPNGIGYRTPTEAVAVAMRIHNRDRTRVIVWDAVDGRAVIDLTP